MSNRFVVSIAIILFLASGLPVLAHHAFANEFDESKPIMLEGVVTRVDWENPHVHYFVDVAQPDGTLVNWSCETGGPNRLSNVDGRAIRSSQETRWLFAAFRLKTHRTLLTGAR